MATKRLKLDRDHIIAMARDPAFYEAAPSFAYLKDAALASYQMFLDAKDCIRCGGEWKFMQGIVDAVFIKIKELKSTDPEKLEEVRGFLESKKGYRPKPIVIYYRRSRKQGKIAKLTF